MENTRQRIVVGVDGSTASQGALVWALGEARLRGNATIEVVHAWHLPFVDGFGANLSTFGPEQIEQGAQALVDRVIASVQDRSRHARIESSVVMDLPAHALLRAAKGADLLVVGSRGKDGLTGLLLGSVSQQVAHHAPCPVVIINPEETNS